jgi:rRNA maturation protein Nop10
MEFEEAPVGDDACLALSSLKDRCKRQAFIRAEGGAMVYRRGQDGEPAFDGECPVSGRQKTGSEDPLRFGPDRRCGRARLGRSRRGGNKERKEHDCRFSPHV